MVSACFFDDCLGLEREFGGTRAGNEDFALWKGSIETSGAWCSLLLPANSLGPVHTFEPWACPGVELLW